MIKLCLGITLGLILVTCVMSEQGCARPFECSTFLNADVKGNKDECGKLGYCDWDDDKAILVHCQRRPCDKFTIKKECQFNTFCRYTKNKECTSYDEVNDTIAVWFYENSNVYFNADGTPKVPAGSILVFSEENFSGLAFQITYSTPNLNSFVEEGDKYNYDVKSIASGKSIWADLHDEFDYKSTNIIKLNQNTAISSIKDVQSIMTIFCPSS